MCGTYLREINKTAKILKKLRKKIYLFIASDLSYNSLQKLILVGLINKNNYSVGISDHSSPEVSGNNLSWQRYYMELV